MSDTTTLEASTAGTSPRRSGALTAMRLAELQGLASSMGISGTTKMRKGDLVAASFRPTETDIPITWTGDLKKPKPPKDDKGKNKDKGKNR